jgi:predicted Fe-S protein YdhL (DUF1289 family)
MPVILRAPAGQILAGARFFSMPCPSIHITDIETAINHWRERSPSPDGFTLAPEVRALAEVYALMVYRHEDHADEASFPLQALAAWKVWYDTTPDTPCIAICSTSQGDDQCKGCGRSFDEVQHWLGYTPAEKRSVWRRITLEHSAWRFNRYAERAAEGPSFPAGPRAAGKA